MKCACAIKVVWYITLYKDTIIMEFTRRTVRTDNGEVKIPLLETDFTSKSLYSFQSLYVKLFKNVSQSWQAYSK